MSFEIVARTKELNQLKEFVAEPGSGFLYLRGRRRVGKSTLLKKLAQSHPLVFYFFGTQKASSKSVMRDFSIAFDEFSKATHLSEIKENVTNWTRIFKSVGDFAANQKQPVTLIFDEIQWLAAGKSGLIERIKEAWLDWEASKKLKVIICGSSNRFFDENVGGEEKILRGLKTTADVWIKPFSPRIVKKYYFPKWKDQEILLTVMFTGGVPYYLNKIPSKKPFIEAINTAFFTQKSIFLSEIDEILNLEFNNKGIVNAHQLISALGLKGKTQQQLLESTGLSDSTISDVIDKLVRFGLIDVKNRSKYDTKKNRNGDIYIVADPFLFFYLQVLEPLAQKIEANVKGQIFSYNVLHGNSYYIPEFSGEAFELLVRSIVSHKFCETPKAFGDELQLFDAPPIFLSSYEDKNQQIDLLIEYKKLRKYKIIEIKWTNTLQSEFIDGLKKKEIRHPQKLKQAFSTEYVLIVGCSLNSNSAKLLKKKHDNVSFLHADSFF